MIKNHETDMQNLGKTVDNFLPVEPKKWFELSLRWKKKCIKLAVPYVISYINNGFNGYGYVWKKKMVIPIEYQHLFHETNEQKENRYAKNLENRLRRKEQIFAIQEELGLKNPRSSVLRAYLRGDIDKESALAISESIRHRHEDTDYDELLQRGISKDDAREIIKME